VREWSVAEASASVAIRRCLKEWLSERPMPSMHFLVEPQTLERLWDRRVFVAERNGAPVGFLVATPVPGRNGWLVEQIVRGRAAPNGTAEALVDAAFRAAAAEGRAYFTLGLSPLSRAVQEDTAQAWWLDLGFKWIRAHGSRFYNFQGLEHFKAKFAPEKWEPIYAICNRPNLTPRMIMAIASAFSGTTPFAFTALTLAKALRQESVWLWRRLFGGPERREP
jgi:phosphatidylglycerol lysyltransferase